MEANLYKIYDNQLTDEEIYTLTMELKQRKYQLTSFYLSTTPLPNNKKYLAQAEQKADNYFRRNNFGVASNVNP